MSASTKVSGSSSSVSSRVPPRPASSTSSASARSRTARGPDRLGLGPGVVGLLQAAVQGQLAGVRRRLVAQFPFQVTQSQVGQLEGPLAGLHQVGGQLGVRRDAGQPPAVLAERQQRALHVVRGLRHGLVGQPAGQRPVVGLGQLGRRRASRLRRRRRRCVTEFRRARAAAPGAGEGQPDPAAVAGVLGQEVGHRRRLPAGCTETSKPSAASGSVGGQGGEQPLAQHPELQVVEQLVHLVAVPGLPAQLADAQVQVARRAPAWSAGSCAAPSPGARAARRRPCP